MKTPLLSLALFLTCICCKLNAQTLAFPGAEGFGRFATGGRGGDVYIVTNLNDSGPGSFRDAVSQPNRIVVFEVGGVIRITTRIVVQPNITIAAQTAPGDGVVIYGNGLSFSIANNTIVRYLRIRMGVGGDSGKDAVTITDNANNQIFDHVSVTWGRDENFSITGHADSITVQNSIIGQGLQTHSCGGLLEPSGALSLYRNLYIDNNTRNPKVKGINQFVNNVAYNWGGGGAYIMGGSAGYSYVNIINNYYIAGPSSGIAPFTRGTPTFIPYVEGNYYDSNRNGAVDGALVPRTEYTGVTIFRDTAYNYPMPAQLFSARQAYDYVLQNAGAVFPRRDPIDSYLINELRSAGARGALIANESELPMGGPGDIKGAPAPRDTDRDGMPDQWENDNGLDPANPADGKVINPDGYTNLEKYINNLPLGRIKADVTPATLQAVTGYPSPFSEQLNIRFRLERNAQVNLSLYDMSGRLLRTLVNRALPAGPHQFQWDGRNAAQQPLPGGVYIYVLQTPQERVTGKVVRSAPGFAPLPAAPPASTY